MYVRVHTHTNVQTPRERDGAQPWTRTITAEGYDGNIISPLCIEWPSKALWSLQRKTRAEHIQKNPQHDWGRHERSSEAKRWRSVTKNTTVICMSRKQTLVFLIDSWKNTLDGVKKSCLLFGSTWQKENPTNRDRQNHSRIQQWRTRLIPVPQKHTRGNPWNKIVP